MGVVCPCGGSTLLYSASLLTPKLALKCFVKKYLYFDKLLESGVECVGERGGKLKLHN